MEKLKWITHKDPANKYSALITLGNRNIRLPADAVISITLGEKFNIWRTIINGLVNQFVMKQLVKSEGLLYSELWGDARLGTGLTLTVWTGRSMANFRDKGAHKFALRFFSWVFYSGQVEAYFLTFKAGESIPAKEEAIQIVKKYGKYLVGGKLIRKQTKQDKKVESLVVAH